MGLDIIAYSKVIHTDENPAEFDYEDEDRIFVFAYAGFHRSTRGLANHDVPSVDGRYIAEGIYDISNSASTSWRAGSYGGYSRFREMLAELGGYPTPEEAWADPDGHADLPFFELVNFADNEGCIGHEAAADLLEDFKTYRDAFHEGFPDWAERYDEWIDGLELAADAGLLYFC